MGQPAFELRRRQGEIRAALANLDAELPIREWHAQEAARKAAYKELEAHLKQAKEYRKAQEAAWKKAGDLYAQMVDVYTALLEAVEAADRLDDEIRHRWQFFSFLSEAEQIEWADAIRPAVTPFPIDYQRFLEKLGEATYDPKGEGFRHPEGRWPDATGALLTLVPDLRGHVRKAELSGRVDRTKSEG